MPSTLAYQILQETSSANLAQRLLQMQLSLQVLRELQQAILPLHAKEPANAIRLAYALYEFCNQSGAVSSALGSWILGDVLLNDRQYLAANRYLAKARQGFLAAGQRDDAARVGVSCVASLAYSGHFSEARQLASEVEETLTRSAKEERNDLRYLARLPLHVALVHELMGEPEQALALYDHHLQSVVSLGDAQLLARINMDRARVLAQVHAFEEAISSYAQAEMLLHTLDNKVDLIKLYLDRNSLLIALGRFDEAAATQAVAQNLLAEIEGMEHAVSWLHLLRVQLSLASHIAPSSEQIDGLRQAQRIFAAQGPIIDECLAWLLLGHCELQQERYSEAQHAFETVLAKSRPADERTLEFRALHGLALVERARGETDEAILLLQLAIDKLELVRQGLQIETCRIAFLSDHLTLYHDLAQLYLEQQAWDRAFATIERAKSRLVGEKLASRLQAEVVDATQSAEPYVRQLAEQLQSALQQLQQINQSVRLRQVGDPLPVPVIHPQSATVTTLEHMVHTLILQIQYQQPRFSSLTSGQSVALEQLQTLLGGAHFIHYFINHQRYHALLIDSNGVYKHLELATLQQVTQLRRLFSAAIERMLALSGQIVSSRLLQRLPALLGDVQRQLQELYQALFLPLRTYLPARGALILSPDSELHSLPFHAFYDGSTYLTEHYTMSYVPNATVLDYCMQQPTQGKGVYLCGYDDGRLAAVHKELDALAQIYPNALVKIGKESTADSFLSHAPQQQIVHLSAHAAFRRDRPMLSSITLAERNLTLAEIAHLNLCADLVGLSGCETGTGECLGSDLLSLASGFLGAGARSLLVSLWRVEDESTAQLVESFYRAMRSGKKLNVALCAAQQEMLQIARASSGSDAIFQHPAFWAPFAVIGHGMETVIAI